MWMQLFGSFRVRNISGSNQLCTQNDKEESEFMLSVDLTVLSSLVRQAMFICEADNADTRLCGRIPSYLPSVQTVSQLVNQFVSQLVRQTVSHSVRQSANQSFRQSVNQSVRQSFSQSLRQSVNQSVSPSVRPSVKQAVGQ